MSIEERFKELETEMRRHYFWCKVKLNTYAIILLVLFFYLR